MARCRKPLLKQLTGKHRVQIVCADHHDTSIERRRELFWPDKSFGATGQNGTFNSFSRQVLGASDSID